jgi:AcrR family transcriptional regulator
VTARRAPDLETRERLLRAGLALAQQQGLRALTVRAVAAEAGANLGSFVYHFGSRDAFVTELIERLYAPLTAQLQGDASGPDALQNLRRVLLDLVGWLVQQRVFLAHLVMDAGAGEAPAQHFLQSMDRRHPALLLALIGQAQQAGVLRRDDPMHQLLFLMSTLAAPVLMFQLVGQHGLAPPALAQAMTPFTVEPALIETRLDWALRALVSSPAQAAA